MGEEIVLFESEAVERMCSRMAHEIVEKAGRLDNLLLLGIARGGVPVADRLAALIARYGGTAVSLHRLDVTGFRDDRSAPAASASANAEVCVQGRHVILVDDVLYTGRTVRSAIDAVMMLGRPSKVELAVLVDRGHRELPIRADYVGKNVPTSREESIEVQMASGAARICLVR